MAEKPKIKQGDAGTMGVTLYIGETLETAEAVTAEDLPLFHCIEFMIGETIRKLWPDEAFFADGEFHVPFTQDETFQLEEGETIKVDVRVHFETNGAPEQVKGIEAFPKVKVIDAISEEVLT